MNDRFDTLPIHRSCFNFNNNTSHADNDIIINCFQSLQVNDPALHILRTNPAVTKDMIKELYSKNSEATAVRNGNDMVPWHVSYETM